MLALDLYLRHGRQLLDARHPDVVALSAMLRTLPLHPVEVRDAKFRNPTGVAMKIANLAYFDETIDQGGLRGGGKEDRAVWDAYAHRPEELRRLTDVLRGAREAVPPFVDVDEGFAEGRIVERLHKSRERSRTLVRAKLADVLTKTGRLACEACGFDFEATYGAAARGMAECHHRVPLSAIGPSNTTLADLAVVCANCHRYLHRVRPMPTVEELRLVLVPIED